MQKQPHKSDRRNLPVPNTSKSIILVRKKQYLVGVLALITLVTASVVTLERLSVNNMR